MINVFKALNPLNIFWLAIALLVLRSGYMFNVPQKLEFEFSGSFSRFLIPTPGQYPFSSLLNILLASAAVFVQALLLNYLVNHYNLLGKPTLLPALMYSTVSGLYPPFLVLSPELVCNFLIIWMLFKLLNLYKSKDAKSTAFDLGMIVGLGSIIYLPFVYLFIIIWIGLIIFRPLYWREFFAAIIGFLCVFFFLAVYYFLNNNLGVFNEYLEPLATELPVTISLSYHYYLLLIPIIIILVLSFIKIQELFFRSYVQVRKSFQLIFIFFILTVLTFYIKAAFHLNHFLMCAVPVSIFFSFYFLYAKTKWFYELLYFILFISIIYFQFNTF